MRAKKYSPQTFNVNNNRKGIRSVRTLLLAFILMIGIPAVSFAAPNTISFANGVGPQNVTVCENGNLNLNNDLRVNYSGTTGTLLTWTVSVVASHGTVTSPFTRTSTGAVTTPNAAGIHYIPTATYVGPDIFQVTVTDGTVSATTTISVTVEAQPTAIAGPTSVCVGQTIALSDSLTGGTWTSTNGGRASVGLTTGIVTGVGSFGGPSPTITYTTLGGCTATQVITVNPLSQITGPTQVCAWGSQITLRDATGGGVWTSVGAPILATGGFGGASNSQVTGQAPGVATITYTLPTGCAATSTVTVNPLPDGIIGGNVAVCVGSSVTLSDSTAGGTWSTNNAGQATVDAGTGIVTGVSGFSTPTISYILPTGCRTSTSFTVNPTPAINSANACLGQTVALSATISGGTWSTNSTGITIDASGNVTGLVAGTDTVTYTLSTGCSATATLTVNPLPGPITGNTTICQGSTTTLSDSTSDGMWSTADANIATVDEASGVVASGPGTGGSTTISYTLPTGCYAATSVTVNQLGEIGGNTSVCIGATTTLNNTPSGGTWSSSNANATIDPNTGVVTGVSWGTTTITYTTPAGCTATRTETIDSLPTLSSGSVCIGSEVILAHSPRFGTWSSSNPSVATINEHSFEGHVHGVSAGIDTITYTSRAGCMISNTVSVNGIYPIIGSHIDGGFVEICAGTTLALSDSAASGTWSSTNTTVLTVDQSTGLISALSAGSASVIYTTTSGCTASINVQVDQAAGGITGTATVCEGQTTTLFDNSTPGGAWSSSNNAIATVSQIDASSATVGGVSGGADTITYTLPTGCFTSVSVAVNPTGTISGILFACRGTSTTLSSTQPGQWSIDPLTPVPVTASVDHNTGVVTGNSNNGPTVIDFITSNGGCVSTTTVTVGSLPAPTGPARVCVGSSITLSDEVAGGVWSVDNAGGSATVGSASGDVTGVSAGPVNIIYTVVPGCFGQTSVTVNALPIVTTGASVCVGSFVTLAHNPLGGTWSSSNPSIATVRVGGPNFGRVTGVSAGIDSVTYTINTGCATTVTVQVNPVPSPIIGNFIVCPGITTTLSDSTSGGVWSSSRNFIATIGAASGIVTGVNAAGGFPTVISYTLPTGCAATHNFNVTNTLNAITGPTPSKVCIGQSITLADPATGGAWTSSDPSVSTVSDSSGIVTGISSGSAVITYSLGAGCSAIRAVAVDNLSPIIGLSSVCVGSVISLSDTSFGGAWSASNGAVTVDPSGVVTGVNGGLTDSTVVINYTMPVTGCRATDTITVNPLPTAIAGIGAGVCYGSMITLSDGIAGGTWSSSDNTIATIDSVAGIVTGLDTGMATITYSLPNGCTAVTASVSVNPLPIMISAHTDTICNNTLVNYDPVSDISGTIFQWSRAAVAGISNPLNTGSGNPDTDPHEVLVNTTNAPIAVKYIYQFYNLPPNCSATDSVIVLVNPTPMLDTPIAMQNVCDSSTFNFGLHSPTDSYATVSYAWNRDTVAGNSAASGSTDSISEMLVNITPDPVVVTYTVTMTVFGCSNTQTISVTVNPKPVLDSPLAAAPVCDSERFVYVSYSLTDGASYSWSRAAVAGISNPSESGTGNTIVDTLVNTTNHPVVVTYVDSIWINGCYNTQNITVTVEPRPRLDSLNPHAICDSTVFDFTHTSVSAGPGATYTWVRPFVGGIDLLAGSGTGNPNELLVNKTNVDVTVTYIYTITTALGCTNTQNVHVVVHPLPRLSSDPGPLAVCSGSTFVYGPTSYVIGSSFAWTRAHVANISPASGAGTGQAIETLIDSTLDPINVDYHYIITANGCSNTADIVVTVNPTANTPAITTAPPNALCLNTMFQNFGVAAAAPDNVHYIWTATNATVWAAGHPDQYALVSFDSSAGPAVVTVTANVEGITCTSSQTYNVNVSSSLSDNPQVIYYSGQFMCLKNLEDTYQWGFDDGVTLDSTLIPGETNETYFCNSPDFTYRHYWVITTHDGCMQKTYYNIPTGVNNVNADNTEVKIYPNPANDIVNVDINTSVAGKLDVEVLDVLGQKITSVPAINHKAQINVANMASGVYLIECYRDGVKINSARFVKN